MVENYVWFSTNHHQPDKSQAAKNRVQRAGHLERWQMIEIPGEKTLMGNEMAETAPRQMDGWFSPDWVFQRWSFGKATTNSYFWTSGSEISWIFMNDYNKCRHYLWNIYDISEKSASFSRFCFRPRLDPSWTGTHHLQWNIRCTRRIPRSVAESAGYGRYGAGTEFMKTLGHSKFTASWDLWSQMTRIWRCQMSKFEMSINGWFKCVHLGRYQWPFNSV